MFFVKRQPNASEISQLLSSQYREIKKVITLYNHNSTTIVLSKLNLFFIETLKKETSFYSLNQ